MSAAIAETSLTLCKFSKSEILASSIVSECPLALTNSTQNACPCKRRRYHVTAYDLRVIECLYPKTWNGNTIRDPESFRASITSMSKNKPGETTMTTAVTDPPKSGVAKGTEKAASQSADKPTSEANSPENNPGLWCGIPIPVIGVSGEKWSGKTLFASSIAPERTLMLDLEDSSASYSGIPFARRLSLYKVMHEKYKRLPTPLECFEWFRNILEKVEAGKYAVCAVDPVTDIEQGMVDWVYSNPDHFGHSKAQYDKAAGIMWGDVKQYWKMLLGIAATKFETLVFTAHMGAVWKGNSPVEGKRKAKGKETLFELASLYLQLERPLDANGKQPDKPSARVLKSRLALSSFEDGEIVHKPILPPYLKVATPKAIREYIKTPPDYAKLKKSEIAPPEEMTEDDRLTIKAGIAENERAAAEANLSRLEQMKQAAEEQARMKRERETQQEANAAQSEAAKVKPDTVTTETGTVLPASHADLAGIQEAGDRGQLRELHAKIKDLFAALGTTPDKILDVLAKRGVKTVEELTAEQAEEIRGKLQLVINDRTAKAKAEASGSDQQAPFN